MNNLIFQPAHKIAEMIRARKVSTVEVLDAHLAQIGKHNSNLNAICTLDEERARTTAKQADEALTKGESWGRLHGVPMTVKDVYETAGLRTTAGYKRLKDYIPTQDATVVQRLRAAGAIIIGKSNLAKLASDYQSTNDLFERVNNPWNLNCTAGGSSGGSAVAVATGMAPLEIGDDIGGSTRQPAHFCGVYSFKPTDRRISTAGHIPEVPGQPKCIRHMLTPGCFARSVEDLRLWFSLSLGTDFRQPDLAPVPLDTPSNKSLQNLKIAWTDGWKEIPVALSIQAAIKLFVNNLTQTGAYTENWSPENFNLGEILQLYNLLVAFSMGHAKPWEVDDFRQVLPFMFREATQGDKTLRNLSNLSQLLPSLLNPNPKKYFEVLTQRDQIIAQLDEALENWDVWLCPVATTTAFTHRAKGAAIDVDGRKIPYLLASGALTMPFAFTGHPVVVIPIGQDNNGLPIGVQVVGKRWREMELLNIARQLAACTQGFQVPPLVEWASLPALEK